MNHPQLYSEAISNIHIKDKTPILDNFLKLIKWSSSDSDTVLDVGVGDGSFAIECLIPRFPGGFGKFIGSDISESMLAFAKEKYNLPNVEYKQLDIAAELVPFEFLNGFNHIFSTYALHWVRDQRRAFLNMHKMLKPGGDMLLIYCAKNPFDSVFEKLSKRSYWKQYDHMRLVSPFFESKDPEKELRGILTQTGFCNIVCHVKKMRTTFSSFEELQNLLISLNPYVLQISSEDRCNYINDMTEDLKSANLYTTTIIETNTLLLVSYDLFVIYASKAV